MLSDVILLMIVLTAVHFHFHPHIVVLLHSTREPPQIPDQSMPFLMELECMYDHIGTND